ncbi:unnamed protein product [Effrenium voratum]|uniref:Uncharacterized protein n=1 Tax=Effrenium voratum TaxID=2562239 RepID=A0AA36NEL7_9DINO|nr:unnamed protein product [Effrenium voratum]CAJ1442844.1 unnamed protein product [Effrenium voratum]
MDPKRRLGHHLIELLKVSAKFGRANIEHRRAKEMRRSAAGRISFTAGGATAPLQGVGCGRLVGRAHLRGEHFRAGRLSARALKRRTIRGVKGAEGPDALLQRAGLWYLLGASLRSPRCLRRGLKALRRGPGGNVALERMKAETLLRLGRYQEAFSTFADLAKLPRAAEELYVSPFRLRHDARLLERLASLLSEPAIGTWAKALRRALEALEQEGGPCPGDLWWASVQDLPRHIAGLLREGRYDRLTEVCPPPRELGGDPLRDRSWTICEEEYEGSGLLVLDGFFSDAALLELWTYATEAPCFRSLRPGYLGAFPWDGCVHPLLRRTAEELETKMPRVLAGHRLARWWFFKYLHGGSGVGLHADDAAVNVNIWLSPEQPNQRGGGLEIYRCAPGRGSWTADFNRVLAAGEEDVARAALRQGGVDRVAYKQNRACIFVSHRYHASEAFDFPDEQNPRVNLTLLFGDRSPAQDRRR